MIKRASLAVLLVLGGCAPAQFPEIGHAPQAQVSGAWCSCQDIAYGQHKGGRSTGQVWVVKGAGV